MGRGARVGGHRLGVAEVVGDVDDLQRVQEPPGRRPVAQVEGHDVAAAGHLAWRPGRPADGRRGPDRRRASPCCGRRWRRPAWRRSRSGGARAAPASPAP